MKPKYKKRYVLGVGHLVEADYRNHSVQLLRPQSTCGEHMKIRTPKWMKDEMLDYWKEPLYRLVLERVK